jgi:hypothetical protein
MFWIAAVFAAPSPSDFSATAEAGFVAPLRHTIQLGQDGTALDYVKEGGQDNLFAVRRMAVEVALGERHSVGLLYQPLDLRTAISAPRDLVFDGVVFPASTPMELRYGFDFYRASWLVDLVQNDKSELSLGLSLQLRNATLDFTSTDGALRTTNRDIGPVPLIKARGQYELSPKAWVGFEVDGFYAPVKYLNGGSADVVGAIVDASVRAGTHWRWGMDPFVNLRYLGGGAEGTDNTPNAGTDGYVENWLSFATVTVGVTVR